MHPTFIQNYDPLGTAFLSTLVAALPVSILLYFLAVRKSPAYRQPEYFENTRNWGGSPPPSASNSRRRGRASALRMAAPRWRIRSCGG